MSPRFDSLFAVALLLAPSSSAFSFRRGVPDAPISPLLQFQTAHSDAGLTIGDYPMPSAVQNAVTTIEKVKEMPLCQQIATASLMHSCSALERTLNHKDGKLPRGSNLIISESIKVYGARLAVCELEEAKTLTPEACKAFVPTEKSIKRQAMAGHVSDDGYSEPTVLYLDSDETTEQHLSQCLTALAQRPQAWTSYSNSKQNAWVMCRAMESVVQKDKTIDIYEELIRSASGLPEYLNRSAEEVNKQFREVKANIMQLWMDLYEHDAAKREEIARFLDGLKEQLEDSVAAVLSDFRKKVLELQTMGSDATEKKVEVFNQAFTNLSNRMSAVAIQQETSVAGTVELFEYSVAILQQQLTQSIGNATQGLQVQQELIDSNYQRILQFSVALANTISQVDTVDGRLKALESAMVVLKNETIILTTEVKVRAEEVKGIFDRLMESMGQFREVIDSINSFFDDNWPGVFGAVRVGGILVGYAVLYTLLAFACWDRWGPFSFLGNVSAALATGFSLSFASTFYRGPVDLARAIFNLAAQAKMSTNGSLTLYRIADAAMLCALCCLVWAGVRYCCNRRNKQPLYDPSDRAEQIWARGMDREWVIEA